MSKSKKIVPRIPEGEAILDQPELTMEELSESFKKRMWEYRQFVKFLIKDLSIKDYSKVLEIGPGPGWITILLAQANPTLKITGLEISEDIARKVLEHIKSSFSSGERRSSFKPDEINKLIKNIEKG